MSVTIPLQILLCIQGWNSKTWGNNILVEDKRKSWPVVHWHWNWQCYGGFWCKDCLLFYTASGVLSYHKWISSRHPPWLLGRCHTSGISSVLIIRKKLFFSGTVESKLLKQNSFFRRQTIGGNGYENVILIRLLPTIIGTIVPVEKKLGRSWWIWKTWW